MCFHFKEIITYIFHSCARPRRKFRISLEALFMIDFPAAKNKFTFYLDRKGKRVTIDINSNSNIFSKQLNVPSLNETSVIRSLALSFAGNTITLYLDCEDVLKDEVEFNLSKLFLDMEEPMVKLFRERKYPLYLDTSSDNALSRASCQKNSRRKSNHKIVRDNERKKHSEGKNVNDMSKQIFLYFFVSFFIVPSLTTTTIRIGEKQKA